MAVHPKIRAPSGLPQVCPHCCQTYRRARMGLRFDDTAAELADQWHRHCTPRFFSRGPVLWAMRAAKLYLWAEHIEHCDGPFGDRRP